MSAVIKYFKKNFNLLIKLHKEGFDSTSQNGHVAINFDGSRWNSYKNFEIGWYLSRPRTRLIAEVKCFHRQCHRWFVRSRVPSAAQLIFMMFIQMNGHLNHCILIFCLHLSETFVMRSFLFFRPSSNKHEMHFFLRSAFALYSHRCLSLCTNHNSFVCVRVMSARTKCYGML